MTEMEILKLQLRMAQQENESLRAELGRRPRQMAFPDEVLAKCPNLADIFYKKNNVRDAVKSNKVIEDFSRPLSKAIRGVLFNETASDGKKEERFITCQQMSDEQYSLFLRTLEAVLLALDKGRAEAVNRRITTRKEVRRNAS